MDPAAAWLRGRHDSVERPALDRIAADLDLGAGRDRRSLLVGIGAVVGLVLLAAALVGIDVAIEGRAAARDLVGSLLLTGPAVIAMLIAGIVVPFAIARRRRLARTVEVMLRHGQCPQCGYRIAEVPTEPATGLTVCPECAAAWRRPGE